MRAINPRLNLFNKYKTMGTIINPYAHKPEIPAIISDGHTLGWWKFTDSNFVYTDINGLVSRVADALGSGHDFMQAFTAKQPLKTATGVLFDGVDDFMELSYTVNEPQNTWVVLKIKTWIATTSVFGRNGKADGRYLIMQSGYPNTLSLYNTNYACRNACTIDSYMIVNFMYNGATSYLDINGVKVTGNPGTIATVPGFILGGGGQGRYSNIEVAELIIRDIVDTPETVTNFRQYLANKYNL